MPWLLLAMLGGAYLLTRRGGVVGAGAGARDPRDVEPLPITPPAEQSRAREAAALSRALEVTETETGLSSAQLADYSRALELLGYSPQGSTLGAMRGAIGRFQEAQMRGEEFYSTRLDQVTQVAIVDALGRVASGTASATGSLGGRRRRNGWARF